MTAREHAAGASAGGSGDPLRDVLLGFAGQIDQLAALIGGNRPGAGAEQTSRIGELAGELGTLVSELGDLLARILSALIAVLEAVAQLLRSAPAPSTEPAAGFEVIPVRISTP